MGVLDRYVARQFLINTAVLFAVLSGFVVLVDLAYNLDRYTRAALDAAGIAAEQASAARRAWLTLGAVVDFWWPWTLYLFSFLLGLVLVAGMGFTLAQMVRHREMVALVAGGRSLHQVARPILLVGLLLAGVSAINQEMVIPRLAPLLIRDQGDAGKRAIASQRLPLTPDAQGRLFYAQRFDPQSQRLEGVYIIERDPATGLGTREIRAAHASWRDGGWDLADAVARGATGDAPRPTGVAAPMRVETSLSPLAINIRLHERFGNTLSTTQAVALARQVRQLGAGDARARAVGEEMMVVGLGRVAGLATNVLVLVMATCLFLTREPVNMFLRAVKCAPIGLIGVVGGAIAKSTPVPGLPAAVSVFLPVLVLAPIAVAMWYRVKT